MNARSNVRFERNGRIAIVTLDRPEARNAVDPDMDERLRDVWRDFRDDDDLDVAIWTGTGDAFCAGADRDTWIRQWLDVGPLEVRRNADAVGWGGLTRGLHRIDKPVICAVNGWALGGGLEFALACDIRIASELARFGPPLVRYGFHTGDGGASRLVDICGAGVALDLQLTGDPIDAERALQCNLVTRVVPHHELMPAALDVAERIVANDQIAVRSAKRTVLDVIGRPLDEQLRIEALNGYSLAERGRQIAEAFETSARSG